MLLCILSTATLHICPDRNHLTPRSHQRPRRRLVPGAKITLTDNATGKTCQHYLQQLPALYQFAADSARQIHHHGYRHRLRRSNQGCRTPRQSAGDHRLHPDRPGQHGHRRRLRLGADARTRPTPLSATPPTTPRSRPCPAKPATSPICSPCSPACSTCPSATTSDSRSGAVNGGRSDQGNVTLDGVDDNDQVGGFAFTGVLRQTQDSIEEFRVTTGGANADAGPLLRRPGQHGHQVRNQQISRRRLRVSTAPPSPSPTTGSTSRPRSTAASPTSPAS